MTDSIENSADPGPRGEHLFCAYCGTEDRTDFGYCDHCGERVAAPDMARFSPHELGKCQVCATENQIHARNCIGCGVAFDEKPQMQGSQQPMSSREPMDPSSRDAAYPDPEPEAPPGSESSRGPGDPPERDFRPPPPPPPPPRVSTAEPKERRDSRDGGRMPPYARPKRPLSRREQFDRWSSGDVSGADNRSGTDEYGERHYEPPEPQEAELNNSGTAEAQLPAELKGYNWGALLLGPIWGIGNRTWVATILFVLWIVPIPPYLGLPMYIIFSVYLGSNANRWAWKSRKWMSTHHFRRTQQNWAFWGFIISPIIVFSILTVPLWSGT